jgi:hypothetical protein
MGPDGIILGFLQRGVTFEFSLCRIFCPRGTWIYFENLIADVHM